MLIKGRERARLLTYAVHVHGFFSISTDQRKNTWNYLGISRTPRIWVKFSIDTRICTILKWCQLWLSSIFCKPIILTYRIQVHAFIIMNHHQNYIHVYASLYRSNIQPTSFRHSRFIVFIDLVRIPVQVLCCPIPSMHMLSCWCNIMLFIVTIGRTAAG